MGRGTLAGGPGLPAGAGDCGASGEGASARVDVAGDALGRAGCGPRAWAVREKVGPSESEALDWAGRWKKKKRRTGRGGDFWAELAGRDWAAGKKGWLAICAGSPGVMGLDGFRGFWVSFLFPSF